jgi:predicted nucleic acid-binding protein
VSGYIADTSIFVAAERGQKLTSPPEGDARVSVATLTELALGARVSDDPPTLRLREMTLARARSFIALPYDETVADVMANLLAGLRVSGRRTMMMDSVIAATAIARGLAVWTSDSDFEILAEVDSRLRVVRALAS